MQNRYGQAEEDRSPGEIQEAKLVLSPAEEGAFWTASAISDQTVLAYTASDNRRLEAKAQPTRNPRKGKSTSTTATQRLHNVRQTQPFRPL